MKNKAFILLIFLLLIRVGDLFAQLTVVNGSALNMTAAQLLQQWLVGQGVVVTNATYNGSPDVIKTDQVGSFETIGNAILQLGLNSGLIMTSGRANIAVGPNNSTGAGEGTGGSDDRDLNLIAGITTYDKAVIEFDFVPQFDTIRFRYVFGSEEFFEFCYSYNDAFGFFLSGPGINGPYSNNSVNIAMMPDGVTPVTINNICDNTSSRWVNPSFPPGPGGLFFQYDGLTYVFTAWYVVQPCMTYHIKLAIADALDHILDSGVFLEKGSFSSSGLIVSNTFSQPKLGLKAVEGCSDATVTFSLATAQPGHYIVHYTIGGTATNCVDYPCIPDSVIIPAGELSASILISPFADGLTEGPETVVLGIETPSCNGPTAFYDTINIVDNTPLIVVASNDTTTCAGDAITLIMTPLGGQYPYSFGWSNGGTQAQTTFIPPVGINTYIATLTDGCFNFAYDTVIVTVDSVPVVSNTNLLSSICSNDTTLVVLISNVTNTIFSWTASASSGNLSGFSPGTGNTIRQKIINSGTDIDTVFYHVTPSKNGCAGPVKIFKVAVYPIPDVLFDPSTPSICSGQQTNIGLGSNVGGSIFSWTATASSPAVTGYSDGNGDLIAQTLTNPGIQVESVTYHITPLASGCPGSVTDYSVVVFPTPDVYFIPVGQTICEGEASSLSLQSHVAGTTYSWTATASSPNLSGYYDSNGNMIVQTISNSGTTVESVTYHVTPVANGCPPGTTQDVVLTVKPRPVLSNIITTFQLCNNTSTGIFLQADIPGSTFAWRAIGSSPNLGGFSGGSGASIIQTLTNSGFTIESVTYRVAATATGCTGDSTDFVVTVFPVPDVWFTPPSQAICPLQTSNITNSSHVPGASFTWTATGSSALVTGFSAGGGNLIQQTLNNSGYNIETVTYHVLPTANGCPGNNGDVVVTVNPAPMVSFTLCIDPVTTTDAQPINLKGGTPVNGTYSGRGVSSAILYPALAGPGMDTIYYSYTNNYGCSRNNYIVISVISPLPFICGNSLTDPRDNNQYPTVQIGTQCWMAANLDYGSRVPSTEHQRDNCTPEKYCFSDNLTNCTSSGGLYQWDELMQYGDVPASQGFCPPGWHVPTEGEWNTLFTFYISNGFAGSPLKYTGYSGFDALLNGVRFKNSTWSFNSFATLFWSSSSHGPLKAWAHGINEPDPSVSYYPSARSNAFPVRCMKN